MSPAHFADQVAHLAAHFALLSVGELLDAFPSHLPRRAVVLTFDDGYADVLTHAAPVLTAHRAPATLFVTTDAIDDASTFWWDDFTDRWFGGSWPTSVTLSIGDETGTWSRRAGETQLVDYYQAHRQLRLAKGAARGAALEAFRRQVRLMPDGASERRVLTLDELRALTRTEGLTIGAHTATHPSLPTEAPADQRREIGEAKTRLEALIGRPTDVFAYPYGDLDGASLAAVRDAGLRGGFAASPRPVTRRSDRFALPRFIAPDCPGAALGEHLEAWFSG